MQIFFIFYRAFLQPLVKVPSLRFWQLWVTWGMTLHGPGRAAQRKSGPRICMCCRLPCKVADPGCSSRIRICSTPDPASLVHAGSASKNLGSLTENICFLALGNMIRVVNPGSGSWIFTPAGSRIQGSTDRNTASWSLSCDSFRKPVLLVCILECLRRFCLLHSYRNFISFFRYPLRKKVVSLRSHG